jgi:hypothetical protein
VADLLRMMERIRSELGDPLQPFKTSALSDGLTSWFDLPKQKIIPGSESVQVQDGATLVTLSSPDGYQMNYELGQLQIQSTPANGSLIIVSGSSWAMFSDEEIKQYLQDAINQHCFNRTIPERHYDTYGFITYRDTPITLTNLPDIEEPLVAWLATIGALWTLSTDAATDASIQTAEGTVVDRATRYQQVMSQISALTERYQEYCGQLNVGVFRIETLTFRRTAQRTGHLEPIFQPTEYDDTRFPTRELPQIDGRNQDNSGIPSQLYSNYGI